MPPSPRPPLSASSSARGLVLRPLVLCVVAMIMGIIATELIPHRLWVRWGLCALLGLVIWLVWLWQTGRPGLLVGLLLLAFGWGGVSSSLQRTRQQARWMQAKQLTPTPQGQRRWLDGTILRRVRWQPGRHTYVMQVHRWSQDGRRWHQLRARIRLQVMQPAAPSQGVALDVGDQLRLTTRLTPPIWYANPGLYDPRPQQRAEGVWLRGRCQRQQVVLLRRGRWRWRRSLSRHRLKLARWLVQRLGQGPPSALLRALLLGDRGGLTPQLRSQFARTGTAHLLAISGLHLAIIAHLCFLLWRGLFSRWQRLVWRGHQRRWAALAAAPWVLAYAGLSGAAPSTQRACLMLCMVWLGLLFDRHPEATNTLALVAASILSWDPMALWTASFQLSFVAVAALLWSATPDLHASDQAVGRLARAAQHLGSLLWRSGKASLWATAATLPLALAFSPHVPLWAPLINLLAIPLGGYLVVGCGLLAVMSFQLWPGLANALLSCSATAAKGLLGWIGWTSTWPGSATLPPLRPWEWVAYGAGLTAWLLRRHRRLWKAAACVAGCSLSIVLWQLIEPLPRRDLVLHFLDVGQGDATLLQLPNGQRMMIDAGGRPYGRFSIGERVLRPHLRWLRWSHIDMAVLSHPHPDHFGGFVGLIGPISIGEFWTTGLRGRHPAYRALQRKLHAHKIPQRRFREPTTLHLGDVELRVLHPFPGRHEGGTYYWSLHANDNSLVLWLRYKQVRILLTGDIERRGEELLLQRWPGLRADVLKVPHHGSRTSSSQALVRQLKPRHAIFCVGRHNRYGFPHKDVLQRYQRQRSAIWRTDHHGRITLRTDGTKIHVTTRLQADHLRGAPKGPRTPKHLSPGRTDQHERESHLHHRQAQ